MSVTVIINDVVYILDDLEMLPRIANRFTQDMPAKGGLRGGADRIGVDEDHAADGYVLAQVSSDTKGAPGEQSSPEKIKILFVEDNDYVRDLTLCLLEGTDREVAAFGSAEDALSHAQRQHFDILITDISLPRMSGIELAKRLLASAPAMWIVFASGYKLPDEVKHLGVNVRSMAKPFDKEQLDAILMDVRVSAG